MNFQVVESRSKRAAKVNQLYVYDITPKTSKEYLQKLNDQRQFNSFYNKCSRSEKKIINTFCEKSVSLWDKVRANKISIEDFRKEGTEILKPCIELAQKMASANLFIFRIRAVTETGDLMICCDTKWPTGFGIVIRRGITVCKDTPQNASDYLLYYVKIKSLLMSMQLCRSMNKSKYPNFMKKPYCFIKK